MWTIAIRNVDVDTNGEDITREAHLVAPTRCDLVRAFALMPDEGFNYIVGQVMQIGMHAGGFQEPSKAALRALTKIATDYFDKAAGELTEEVQKRRAGG